MDRSLYKWGQSPLINMSNQGVIFYKELKKFLILSSDNDLYLYNPEAEEYD